jgi:site-specific DNA-methyltransferase (adenine-specific)
MKATQPPSAWTNTLYFGDNLQILRSHIADDSVDLIYLDPPFNSNATYNVLFGEHSGEKSAAQITAFDDTWHWGQESEQTYWDVVTRGPAKVAKLLSALRECLGNTDMLAYLTMMTPRLVELHRVLKSTGSLYLHCDPTASHYLKMVMDAIFGPMHFQNEIVWKRTSAHNAAKRWGPIHDIILFYTGSESFTWNRVHQEYDPKYLETFYRYKDRDGRRFRVGDLTGAGTRSGESGLPWKGCDPTAKGRHWAIPRNIPGLENLPKSPLEALASLDQMGRVYWPEKQGGVPGFKRYLDDMEGMLIQDMINDIAPLSAKDKERMGYPTQKPETLLERIIKASSNEGDVVLDPFCGCGTAIAVSERLNRRWIGIDITHIAMTIMKHRLETTFPKDLAPYEVIGVPKDVASAQALAQHNRYQFEWWALDLIEARPAQDKKKGADRGVDGEILFRDDQSGKPKRIVVQVKSGHVNASYVRDLAGVLQREQAAIGVLVTLNEPTKPMRQEAAAAGFYVPTDFPQQQFPRLQLLTIAELLQGKPVQYPRYAPSVTFPQAGRRQKGTDPQPALL